MPLVMTATVHDVCVSVCMRSLRPLFVALNDEAGVVRALAIRVVGRLAGRNPAYVMPALRRHLMQLLSDMDHLPDSRHREGERHITTIMLINNRKQKRSKQKYTRK